VADDLALDHLTVVMTEAVDANAGDAPLPDLLSPDPLERH
jgi:hypothetical protein